MSLYTPIFPPSIECRSAGRNGAPSSDKPIQPSSTEILRDIHLFLATKPEVLVPSSRPSSPSFDANVEKLKRSVLEAIDAARGDTGNRKWKHVSEKLKMGCVRGRYRMTGLNPKWHQPEDADWILPDDEDTWFKLEKERAEARKLKGKAKQSRHPDDTSIAAVTPSCRPDLVDIALPVEIVDVQETVSPKTMHNVKEKVTKWRSTITTFEGAPGASKTVTVTSGERDPSKSDILKGSTLTKNKSQSSSLGFPVVKRNIVALDGKKGAGHSDRNPNFPANGVQEGCHIPNGSKSLAAQERQAAQCDGEPEKASFKTPLRPVLPPDGELPKITDFPETPYIPPSFPSQLETSTPLRHDIGVPVRIKPPPIHPVSPSSPIRHPSTPRGDDRHHLREDPYPPLHPNDPKVYKRPPSPYDAAASTMKKRREMSAAEGNSASPSRLTTSLADEVEKSNYATPPRGEGRLPTLTELLGASPCPKIRSRPPLEDILIVESQSEPSSHPHPAQENPSPVKSYFSTPGSGPSNSPASTHNLLLHSPVSPMLSFAQNPDAFLPQYTSTQAEGSRRIGTSSGAFGIGYSSQFDVEKHVDRVSELLEKDVDFDGWLRDVPAVEEQEESQHH